MIAGDAVGRLAVAQEPTTGTTFVLNAAVGLFVLTGEPATFGVTFQLAVGAFGLSGQSATFLVKMPVAVGQYLLTGSDTTLVISAPTQPMLLRRDYWDVDEWGRFIPGGGVRYTL